MRLVDRAGPERLSISGVAADLGVIRPTVYRYYGSTEHLFTAMAEASVGSFLDAVTARLAGITDPVEWVVETVASGVELLPEQRYLLLLLDTGDAAGFARSFTSDAAISISRPLFDQAPFDWAAIGFDPERLAELEEVMLRFLQSLILSPSERHRTGDELRRFLRSWLAPAVRAVMARA